MIAIISKNRGLGKDNKLLFHIPGELPRFKKITMGHPVIMGRKTFESIGKPLPGRLNIVVTRNSLFTHEGIHICASLTEAITLAKQKDQQEIFILGGGQIYEQAIPFADRLYLTVVDKQVAADTFFPEYVAFTKVTEEEMHENGGYKYTFLTVEK